MARPAGAQIVAAKTCDDVVAGGVTAVIKGSVFGSYTVATQLNALNAVGGVLRTNYPDTQKAYKAFRAAGYPKSFPVVQDLATLIRVEAQLLDAVHKKNLAPVSSLYLQLVTANNQYLADTDAADHAHRSVCDS